MLLNQKGQQTKKERKKGVSMITLKKLWYIVSFFVFIFVFVWVSYQTKKIRGLEDYQSLWKDFVVAVDNGEPQPISFNKEFSYCKVAVKYDFKKILERRDQFLKRKGIIFLGCWSAPSNLDEYGNPYPNEAQDHILVLYSGKM